MNQKRANELYAQWYETPSQDNYDALVAAWAQCPSAEYAALARTDRALARVLQKRRPAIKYRSTL